MKPTRLKRTFDLLDSYGALLSASVETPRPCTIEDLQTAHSEDYIQAVAHLSAGQHVLYHHQYGLGTGDNPVFPGMWEAGTLYTGASLDAAQAVNEGRCRVAMNISGGLHHAHYDRASGFCLFNDCVVAIHRLLKRFKRVAYVDIDVHHSDGVQEAFYDSSEVLTISIHETGLALFPGTGFTHEIGVREGTGYSVNLPMWPYTNDEIWIGSWRETALPILNAFNPDAICLEIGADPHYLDPLARLCLTAQGWLEVVKDVKALGKPIVALGGGGYNLTTIARMWALAYGILFDVEMSDDVPASYAYQPLMPTLRDHEEPPIAPHDVEQARHYAAQTVSDVKRLLFGYHGL